MLANANVIGIWVDHYASLNCENAGGQVCSHVPRFFQNFDDRRFLLLLVGMTAFGFVLTAVYRIGFSRASADAVSRFYDEVTLRTSRFPIQFFDTNPVGRIVTRFSSDYGNVFRLFGGPLAEFFAIVFDLLCMLILVSIASPYYLPIIAFIALANYGLYRRNRERLRLERRELSVIRSPSIAHFAETAQGASTIRIFGRQATFMKRFGSLNGQYLNQRVQTTAALTWFSLQMNALSALLLLLTGVLGYWLSNLGYLSVGSIGVAFTFIVFSGTSIQMFFEWFAQFEEAMTGVERLNEYLRRAIEPGARLPAQRQFPTDHASYTQADEKSARERRMVSERSASIAVEGLWFRYGAELPYILRDLNFQIRAGEKIGIVGRTGSGKTSFVQCLFYLYPFEKGRILVDGQLPELGSDASSVARTDLSLFRRNIALISQEPTLFRGSVRENLDLPRLHSDEKLRSALVRVGLERWLKSSKNDLETRIEERGRNLSAGERQLMCMARCLLQDAPVIVMDEATSAIDPQSEEILVRATEEFFSDRTQVIIAHRLSTLKRCDRVLWLHEGEVKMFDRPEVVIPIFESTRLTT